LDQVARSVHLDLELDGPTADGAVLNIALVAGRTIHQGIEALAQ
jgi:hypothetical protein